MNKIVRRILICLLCTASLFCAACEKAVGSEVSNKTTNETEAAIAQEGFTFALQEIQPIEENPALIDFSDFYQQNNSENAFYFPSFNGDISSLLQSIEPLLTYEGQEILDNIKHGTYEGTNAEENFSCIEDYVEYSTENSETGSYFIDNFIELINNCGKENIALLYKVRFSEEIQCVQFMVEVNGIRAEMNIIENSYQDFALFMDGNDCTPNNGSADYLIDYQQWYNVLISLDKDYNYKFLMWQDTDPTVNVYRTYDLNSEISKENKRFPYHYCAEVSIFTDQQECCFDLESVKFLGYEENFSESEKSITYTDDEEEYQLTVELFNQEDYYNAYLLLKELSGYSTSGSYLVECERLLQTIQIENRNIAKAIGQAMAMKDIEIYKYLYVFQAEKIESLDLSGCRIDDLSFITSFPNLKELNLDQNMISDLMPLKDLYSLERLSLAENNISDVRPLYNLTNLKCLNLSGNIIEDVAALGNIASLKEIDLSINNIYTIAGLYTLEILEKVNLSNNFIYSVNALNNSPIKELNILNTNIDHLGAVAELGELEVLRAGFKYLMSSQIENQSISKYENGDHWWMGLTGLKALESHQNLKYLELARLEAGYEDDALEPLATIPNLESLIFYRYNGTSGDKTLEKLTNLKELTLDTWMFGFGTTCFLPKLVNLEKLSILNFCHVDDLAAISGLTKLTELRIYQYGDSLDFISNLKNLRLLQLIDWETTDYSPLLGLDNLEYLELRGMIIDNISDIFKIDTLKFLKIFNDRGNISSIEGIRNLKDLEYFSLIVDKCSDPAIRDETLFNCLGNLRFLNVHVIEGENMCGYGNGIGNNELAQQLEQPSDEHVEIPNAEHYSTWNYDLEDLGSYNDEQDLIIMIEEDYPYNDDPIKLVIPQTTRNLYITCSIKDEVKIELDCTGCVGLERIVVGEIYRKGDPYDWGDGNFVIENLDALSNCINLREVYINDAQVNDIRGIAGCENIQIIQLRENNINDISALEDKLYLKELDLSGNSITNIEVLESCIRLQR